MSSLFGTDGVRGIPGEAPLTADTVRRLAISVVRILSQDRTERSRSNGIAPVVLIGRDTRKSGPEILRWLAQGFAQAGCLVKDIGVVPTPAVSYLVPHHAAICGVVVSASHNPSEFNGIKFFDRRGFKLSTDFEKRIEAHLPACSDPGERQPGRMLIREPEAVDRYREFLRSSFPATIDLSGTRIVLDAANGAAAAVAPGVLRGLGAEVFELGCSPNGVNINKSCGALAPERMQKAVRRRKAHIGIALDGDADRALLADERGRMIGGDEIICFCAKRLHDKGMLRGDTVVLSVMANLGVVEHLRQSGIHCVEVAVGDRSVTAALEAGGYVLGGESSGHVVFRHLAPTGDGLLTALQVLAALRESGVPASALRGQYSVYPQILKNLRTERRIPLERLPTLQQSLKAVRKRLKGTGRVLVRYSGTEPLLRILVEGRSGAAIRRASSRLVRAFQQDVKALTQGV